MKITILVDNTALFDRYFTAEHGFSAYIEAEGSGVLFDTGYSDAVIKNAQKMQIDLFGLDFIVLSHGHSDHTGGLYHLIRHLEEAKINNFTHRLPELVAHPRCFYPREKPPLPNNGSLLDEAEVLRHFPVNLSDRPVWITNDLVFLGEIPRRHSFEQTDPGKRRIILPNGITEPDSLLDDSALAFHSAAGLVIITGCSHAGICNITEYAREVCGENRVLDIIGGLHLRGGGPQVEGTLNYLQGQNLAALHPCHCTALPAKVALARVAPLEETGVGLRLEYSDR